VLHYSLTSMAALAPTVIIVRIMDTPDSKFISGSLASYLSALIGC
jgi:hypothetical protein